MSFRSSGPTRPFASSWRGPTRPCAWPSNRADMPVRYRLKPALYRDSVALMRLAADLQARPGIHQAAALMATPANQAALAESGLALPAGLNSRPDDLLLLAAGDLEAQVEAGLDWAEDRLLRPARAEQ